MKRMILLAAVMVFYTVCAPCASAAGKPPEQAPGSRIEIKDGWYYLNGQKFFVNALGYEIGARPGQHPYEERFNEPERVKQDMKVIKAAGYNAVRTWSELSEDELKVVQASGLKIIFGIGFRPDEDFADPAIIDE